MIVRFATAAIVLALAACTPPATDSASAPAAATPQPDLTAATPASGPAAPNTTDTLASTPPANAAAPAVAPPATTAPAATPAPPPAQATASAPPSAATPAELAIGRAAYARTCAMCHGPKGEGTAMGVALAARDLAAIKDKIAKGMVKDGDKMPPMAGMLQGDELDDVAKFVAAGLPQ